MKAQPITWYGGKGILAAQIIPLFPPHKVYVEPFGGGAAILFAKRRSPLEVYNDKNGAVVDFFKVLSDPKMFAEFERRVSVLCYSRKLYEDWIDEWEREKDMVKRVAMWFTLQRQSFSGRLGAGWSPSLQGDNKKGWFNTIDRLPDFHARMKSVHVEYGDWEKVVDVYDSKDTLFYLDPPYIHDTRKAGSTRKYLYEMTNDDHKRLVKKILAMKGASVLSGYAHKIYKPLEEAGWKTHEMKVSDHTANTRSMGGKRDARIEVLWVSPRKKEGLWK